MLIYLPCCNVVFACQGDVQVALIIAEIQVDLSAIRKYIDLTVPRWAIEVSTCSLDGKTIGSQTQSGP
jgi:hypothetical protein